MVVSWILGVIVLAVLTSYTLVGLAVRHGQSLGQFAIAAVPVFFGLRIDSIASPFGQAVELPTWLGMLVTVLWIVGMINAINLIDVMDGLAGGIAMMGAAVLFVRSLWFGQHTIAVLPLALAGATLGFLPHNFHPA